MSEPIRGQGSLRWLWLAFAVVIVDQGSKLLAEHLLVVHDPVVVRQPGTRI